VLHRFDEFHRYFPEWADRKTRSGVPREAERNSYLACGYAEEFGYRVTAESPLALPPLLGDPERGTYWCVQIGALHPGYPECPRPMERFDREESMPSAVNARTEERRAAVPEKQGRAELPLVVGQRAGARDRLPIRFVLRWKAFRMRQRAFHSPLG